MWGRSRGGGSRRRFPGGVDRTQGGDGGGDRPSFKYADQSEFGAGSVTEKGLGEGTEVGERSEGGRGGRAREQSSQTSFLSTRSMMAVNDGKAEKELQATTVATSNGYLSDGENSCRRFLRVRGTGGRGPMVNF